MNTRKTQDTPDQAELDVDPETQAACYNTQLLNACHDAALKVAPLFRHHGWQWDPETPDYAPTEADLEEDFFMSVRHAVTLPSEGDYISFDACPVLALRLEEGNGNYRYVLALALAEVSNVPSRYSRITD